MALDIRIQDIKLSFLWIETLPELLDSGKLKNAPMSFLRTGGAYAQVFDRLRRGESGPNGLELPWHTPRYEEAVKAAQKLAKEMAPDDPPDAMKIAETAAALYRDKRDLLLRRQRFWTGCLQRLGTDPLTGRNAWRNLIPLRGKPPFKAQPRWEAELPVTLEGFFYPHGIGFVVTAQTWGAFSLEQTVDLAYTLRRNGRYDLRGPGYEHRKEISLDEVAETGLKTLREMALGPGAAPGIPFDQDPYSLVTIQRASGKDSDAEPVEFQELHQALNAMSRWPPNWRKANLPAFQEATREAQKDAAVSCVLYITRRGQIIWCPDRFGGAPGTETDLPCYHRNQLLAALHVESLSGLASVGAEAVKEKRVNMLPPTLYDCIKYAAGILGTMYGGERKLTYASLSIPRHIEMNDRKDDVEQIRQEFLNEQKPLRSARI